MVLKYISNFKDINIDTNTLVICDIDDTLLKSKKNLNYFYQIIKNDFKACEYTPLNETIRVPHEFILNDAKCMQQYYNRINGFVHTDLDGFTEMINTIKKTQSQIIFLTARSQMSENYTKQNFKDIGLNYDDFTTYYTNNIKIKGQYIKDHIDLSLFNSVVFIDDNIFHLESVMSICEGVVCYKFEIYDNNKIISDQVGFDINDNKEIISEPVAF